MVDPLSVSRIPTSKNPISPGTKSLNGYDIVVSKPLQLDQKDKEIFFENLGVTAYIMGDIPDNMWHFI